ncbi:MAG: hypothetical protein CL573_04605 [Alphaproteobacteria bacterium]|nr:hypothetical protein [Alphaproteobacteria bacterium]HCP00708.1 hypothetical protein [Rhodospirillaceae bacterium]|tara:strand:+ start:85 stop:432 length:348 start_codon:yes stop_codon:yes gene_type:complete
MGLLNKVLGKKDVVVNGKQHVSTFTESFKESFGTEIRVYKSLNTGRGSKRADPKQTLASICERKVEGIVIKKSHTVGQIEETFKNKMGIGIQIMLPDGKEFAPNGMRLKDVSNVS